MTLGATGGVLASATLVPQHWKKIIALVTEGRLHDALAEQKRLWPLFDAIYRETNPAPLKQALALLGYDAGEPRLPLRPVKPETRSKMEEALSYLRDEKLLHL
jgi:4-hydroxy-tetrahydrodipicolinate synthase